MARTTIDELLARARAGLERLEPEGALEAQRNGALLVDVRSDGERASHGVIPGSLHVPRTVLEWRVEGMTGSCDAGKQQSLQLGGNKVWWAQDAREQFAWRCVFDQAGKPVRLEAEAWPEADLSTAVSKVANPADETWMRIGPAGIRASSSGVFPNGCHCSFSCANGFQATSAPEGCERTETICDTSGHKDRRAGSSAM